MGKISMKARKEVIQKNQKRYLKTNKKDRGLIISQVCESTVLSRDRAARLLKAPPCICQPKIGSFQS